MADTAGTPRVRALAAALKRVLDASPMSLREIGRHLDLSHTTLSQWQNGKRVPEVEDVAAVLGAVGVTGETRDEILDLAKHAVDPNWLTTGVPGINQHLAGVIQCEQTATEIVVWQPWNVPGLTQTLRVAREVISGDETLTRIEVDERATVRMERQEVLTVERDSLPPLVLSCLIGEAALRDPIGYDLLSSTGDRTIWAEQLRHLVEVGTVYGDRVEVRVVPTGQGWHSGRSGPFTIYNFAKNPSIVSLEPHRSGSFLYDEPDVRDYKIAAGKLRRRAMSEPESLAFIAELLEEWERGNDIRYPRVPKE
ncbi:helix-turn-helix domain-containing protein [Kutzneria buriramensis]|nr:helix-turn-helix transcriptional regulator [Kutzneria buriramensis]